MLCSEMLRRANCERNARPTSVNLFSHTSILSKDRLCSRKRSSSKANASFNLLPGKSDEKQRDFSSSNGTLTSKNKMTYWWMCFEKQTLTRADLVISNVKWHEWQVLSKPTSHRDKTSVPQFCKRKKERTNGWDRESKESVLFLRHPEISRWRRLHEGFSRASDRDLNAFTPIRLLWAIFRTRSIRHDATALKSSVAPWGEVRLLSLGFFFLLTFFLFHTIFLEMSVAKIQRRQIFALLQNRNDCGMSFSWKRIVRQVERL